MLVIARVNNKEYDIVNNQTFIIEQIKSSYETIVLKDEDQIINVPFDEFQKLFYVAFCITVHKSQGQAFDHPYTIHEFDKFDWRLRYVALSRSTDIKNINIV
jgi:ATP-dependent exoDNAse (exonuclease V) alpha subunit